MRPASVIFDLATSRINAMTGKEKKRAKYTRPCDACALRKIRCDGKRPCTRCTNHSIACTDIRLRRKTGPKKIQNKTRQHISSSAYRGVTAAVGLDPDSVPEGASIPIVNTNRTDTTYGSQEPGSTNPSSESVQPSNLTSITTGHSISIDKLLPYLQVYQTWFYGVWPVLSVAHLVSRIVYDPGRGLDFESTSAYGLACAVAAAIARQVTFLTTNSHINLPNEISSEQFVAEALRARKSFDYRLQVTKDSLLTAFFLYVYYVNVKGGVSASILYLREAISVAQILGYHDTLTYADKTPAEVHHCRKIYYMLVVTERFMCIEDKLPVILDAAVPYPSLGDEEYAGLLSGFTELVKIFAIPDRRFFDKFIELSSRSEATGGAGLFDTRSQSVLRRWIENVQTQLEKIEIASSIPDSSKLNLLLSQHWMRSLAWHISRNNGLLLKIGNSNDYLSPLFPVKIAHDFLAQSEDLPIVAYESNGPGVSIKLLEIGTALADAIAEALVYRFDTNQAYGALDRIFKFISFLKNDLTMPKAEYERLYQLLCNRSMVVTSGAFITEVSEDDDSSRGDAVERRISEVLNGNGIQPNGMESNEIQTNGVEPGIQSNGMEGFDSNCPSPFTQMTLAFSIPVEPMHTSHESSPSLPNFETDVFM